MGYTARGRQLVFAIPVLTRDQPIQPLCTMILKMDQESQGSPKLLMWQVMAHRMSIQVMDPMWQDQCWETESFQEALHQQTPFQIPVLQELHPKPILCFRLWKIIQHRAYLYHRI
jgi:hypothetical protein